MGSWSAADGATARGLQSIDDDLQSRRLLVTAEVSDVTARCAGRRERGDKKRRDQQHVQQNPTRRIRRKTGRSGGRGAAGPQRSMRSPTSSGVHLL